jgi:hypothetical protein
MIFYFLNFFIGIIFFALLIIIYIFLRSNYEYYKFKREINFIEKKFSIKCKEYEKTSYNFGLGILKIIK